MVMCCKNKYILFFLLNIFLKHKYSNWYFNTSMQVKIIVLEYSYITK